MKRTFVVILPDINPETGNRLRETVVAAGHAIGPSGNLSFARVDASGDDEEDWPWIISYAHGLWDQVFEVNGLPALWGKEDIGDEQAAEEDPPMQGLLG